MKKALLSGRFGTGKPGAMALRLTYGAERAHGRRNE
jgi:hypothetical protein